MVRIGRIPPFFKSNNHQLPACVRAAGAYESMIA